MAKKVELKNPYALYERAVQSVEFDVDFFTRVFQKRVGRFPLSLREDFCGTFRLCCEWSKSQPERIALGLELDPSPLAYGKRVHLKALEPSVRRRISIQQKNVLSRTQPADLIVAQNFSYCVFHERADLIRYFRFCRASLKSDGLFFLDIFGGPETEMPRLEKQRISGRDIESFDYFWELRDFSPVTRIANYYIHFRNQKGHSIRNAFHYSWRMWTIPEIREMLRLAGFSDSEVLWEGDSENYFSTDTGENDPTWLAYIVAKRGRNKRKRT